MNLMTMKIIDQDIFGDKLGNCFPACLATLLGLPLSEVPNFCTEHEITPWFPALIEWLKPRGYAPMANEFPGDPDPFLQWVETCAPNIPWIANGKSPRGEFQHSVVYIGSKMFHDPHPSRQGIEDVQGAIFLLREAP